LKLRYKLLRKDNGVFFGLKDSIKLNILLPVHVGTTESLFRMNVLNKEIGLWKANFDLDGRNTTFSGFHSTELVEDDVMMVGIMFNGIIIPEPDEFF